MELVMSPGNLGDNDGSPFRKEDVREWSRVDRLTGMLERARIETGRWRDNTQGAAQSYGKMVDSRERNSADGNLVQKSRRQVEVFQSQAPSGRSFQCVKATQWASSRVTDSTYDIPPTRPINTSHLREMRTDNLDSKFGIWRLREEPSDLDRLTYLCRKLHSEAMNKMWSFGRSSSPLSIHERNSFNDLGNDYALNAIGDKQSTSSDDLRSLVETENISPSEIFARNSKERRSLQIPHTLDRTNDRWRTSVQGNQLDSNQEFNADQKIGNRVKQQNDFTTQNNNYDSEPYSLDSQNYQKPSASPVNEKTVGKRYDVPVRRSSFESPALPKTNFSVPSKIRSNKTVVHVRNESSPDERETNKTKRVNVAGIKLDKDPKTLQPVNNTATIDQETAKRAFGDSPTYGTLMESSSLPKEDLSSTNGKPVKKVEFCKTEIHFAPDSGQVNIVETDGKPPPKNKFRRRKRNSSTGVTNSKNLPLVHFGDTSYEKYIFGGGKNLQPKKPSTTSVSSQTPTGSSEISSMPLEEIDRIHWTSQKDGEIRERDHYYRKDGSSENAAEQANNRGHRTASHGADRTNVSKGIHLDFGSVQCRSTNPLTEHDRTNLETKITRPTMLQNSFSNLKSVQLVMSLIRKNCVENSHQDKPVEPLSLKQLFSPLNDSTDKLSLRKNEIPERTNSAQLRSLRMQAPDHTDRSPSSERENITDNSSTQVQFMRKADVADLENQNSSQIGSNDSQNKVLLKTVTTHKPTVARVESGRVPKISKNQTDISNAVTNNECKIKSPMNESNGISSLKSLSNKLQAKEPCDNCKGETESLDTVPTYENVFEMSGNGEPVYENCQVVKNIPHEKISFDNVSAKKIPSDTHGKINVDSQDKRVLNSKVHENSKSADVARLTNDKNKKVKRDVVRREKKSHSPLLSMSNINNRAGTRETLSKVSKDPRNMKIKQNSSIKKKESSKSDSKLDSKSRHITGTSNIIIPATTTSSRLKKPVEVVYQTAIFNMKNEKLSKTSKKDPKGRYINDLICGSKTKRPSNNKKAKTAVVSHKTNNQQETLRTCR